MRIRSNLGWLQAAALLALAACDDGDSSSGGGPTCEEICDAGVEGRDAASGPDASGSDASGDPIDGATAGNDGGDGSDTGVGETDSALPMECDCGADAGDAGNSSDAATGNDAGQDAAATVSCSDGVKNGSETDVDCGGSCAPCAKGLACAVGADCAAPLGCGTTLTCAAGPTAGFTLAATSGDMPFNAVAASTAATGDTAIVTTEYNWGGAGAAFEATATHRYKVSGTFAVRQRVTDGNGLVSESAPQTITVSDYAVRFSATDKTAEIALTNNRLDVGINNNEGGVRSDASIAPGSGVFYFESKQLFTGRASARIGVGTASAALLAPIGENGSPSVGVNIFGVSSGVDTTVEASPAIGCNGSLDNQDEIGFVIDYRTANARIHFVTDSAGAPIVRRTCTMVGVTGPLFIIYGGSRDHIGPALRINTGSDTTNHPFHFPTEGVKAALVARNEAGAAAVLVPGFGKTRARAADAAPVVNVVASATTVPIGTPVTLTATANDAVDGNMTSEVEWLDVSSQFWSRANGVGVGKGASFTFTPDRIGRYPIDASVTDSSETTTTTRVMIEVTGTLQSFPTVRLAPDPLSDPAIQVQADGLGANFVSAGKAGIRANQGLYGQFWYFEAHRGTPAPEDLGVGVVIKGGNLNQYEFAKVPWSASLNMASGIWRNLISQASYPTSFNHYGFAVDYRGLHPIVYVIVNHEVMAKMTLDEIWEPIYPMVYGNNNAVSTNPDVTVDFTAPFVFNPAAALTNAGENPAGLELGWGI